MQRTSIIARVAVLAILILAAGWIYYEKEFAIPKRTPTPPAPLAPSEAVAYFSGGCFWCTEADFEKVSGVTAVISGYAGGRTEHPRYEDVVTETTGHRETVEVRYDPATVSYRTLVDYFFAHIDPLDPGGQFIDRGESYTSAVFYKTSEEEIIVREVLDELSRSGAYDGKIVTQILPFTNFYPAEEYHQDYYKKNPTRYSYYRSRSGRDERLAALCLLREEKGFSCGLPTPSGASANSTRSSFTKPSDDALRRMLTPLQYEVTQKGGTEEPFKNPYDKNFDEGIYVDIVSGEPLYLSKDKYDSGTGWPSFVKPITSDAVVLSEDDTLFTKRTEVKSRFAGSHLGHVFDDGPIERGGKRYCMNSAAMRFVPKAAMEKEGYGDLLRFLDE